MNKYLNDLKTELEKQPLSQAVIDEIIKDHEEMIKAAIDDGLSEAKLTEKFGEPSQIAEELSKVEKNEDTLDHVRLFQTFEVKEAFKVNCATVNDDITYKLSKTNDLQILTNDTEMKDHTITFEDNVLTIRSNEKTSMSFFNFFTTSKKKTIVIEIPKDQCKRLFHKGVNGPTKLESLTLESAELNTVNGRLKIEDATINHATFHTVNGKIIVHDLRGKQLHTSQVNGNQCLEKIAIEDDITINTVSGDSAINTLTSHRLHLKSVSGRIKGNEVYPKVCQLRSVSGSILIENKTATDIDVEKERSVSGTVKIVQPNA